MNESLIYLALAAPVAALLFVVFLVKKIFSRSQGNEAMQRIAVAIQKGAAAFLKTEYTYIAGFVTIVAIVLGVGLGDAGPKTALSFVVGATLSALAGWIGMYVATRSAVRTTEAAKTSLADALTVAFGSGSVMGLCVVGLGLFGLTALYLAFGRDELAIKSVFGFSFGASSIALFARVGGGIFTKAADVGADLVGKVEAGIPEDDPRNPATIADNVGDNVGDVAGMGADLFESYVGSIIATVALGYTTVKFGDAVDRQALVIFPLALSGVGIISSIIAMFFVKTNDEKAIHTALFRGLIVASLILLGAAFALTKYMKLPLDIFYTVASGLIAGVVIGKLTEYYTAGGKKPVQSIVDQTATGPATVLIQGLAVGMRSCGWPVLAVCGAILVSFHFGGIYGIALAAVGMLSTLGISLGVDAYGPVADNAGGLAEMSHCPPEVRKRTDSLDAVGNTTAAIGKGFAIGSAALTALALLAAFGEEVIHAVKQPEHAEFLATLTAGNVWEFRDGKLFSIIFDVSNARVLVGLLIGAMLPFLFSAMSMQAVGRAAGRMVEEVRRQFKSIPGLMEGKADPDYTACVSISTKAAVGEMIVPGLMAVAAPLIVGFILGPAALGGMLAGSTVTGVLLAIMMANAGGAWDNAKKEIEAGQFGGKGSPNHKAAVVGDTVGDPFKDTAGPSLNILIKLMCIVSVVFVPLFVKVFASK